LFVYDAASQYFNNMPATTLLRIFSLLAAFQVKHFLSDFPFQREFMIRNKGRADWGFVVPLGLHCGVHSLLTLAILLFFSVHLWWLAFVDFAVHFTMDRVKSGPRYLGRFHDMSSAAYWNCFGFDQLVHHFTHYFIIWMVITH